MYKILRYGLYNFNMLKYTQFSDDTILSEKEDGYGQDNKNQSS